MLDVVLIENLLVVIVQFVATLAAAGFYMMIDSPL